MRSSPSAERRLAAVWFADVAGFTELSSRDERASLRLVERFEASVKGAVTAHGGTVVKFLGDGALAHFPSTEAAVRAGLQLRDAFDEHAAVRVGVHVGDILIRSDADVLGDGVNIAARLQGAADRGEVVVSDEAWRQLRHTGAFRFESRGARQLKGLPEKRAIWAVTGLAGDDAPAAPRPRRSGRRRLALLVMGAFAVVGAGWLWHAWPPMGGAAPDVRALVVLPFDNLSGSADEEYFVAGMHDALIGELTEIGALRVISRTSAVRYRDSRLPLAQIARELNVDAIVAASVLRSGERVRIRAELIRVSPREESLWAGTYDREMRDVLALHSDLAGAIADAIHVTLTPGESARLARSESVNPAAYDAYLQGRFHWNLHTERDLERALRWFEVALEHDSGHAPAFAGIASVWYGRRQMGIGDAAYAASQAKAAALRALELDSDLARAHEALAVVLAWYDWDWAGAERHFRRALELNPSEGLTRSFYSLLLRITGRPDDGLRESARALEYDPHNPIVRGIHAGHLMEHRRHDEMLAALRAALDDSPGHPVLMRDYAAALHVAGRHAASRQMVRTYYRADGDAEIVAALDAGTDYSDAMLRVGDLWAARASAGDAVPATWPGRYYLRAGDLARSLEWFERAVSVRDHGAPHLSLRSYAELRNEPQFAALLARMGL